MESTLGSFTTIAPPVAAAPAGRVRLAGGVTVKASGSLGKPSARFDPVISTMSPPLVPREPVSAYRPLSTGASYVKTASWCMYGNCDRAPTVSTTAPPPGGILKVMALSLHDTMKPDAYASLERSASSPSASAAPSSALSCSSPSPM